MEEQDDKRDSGELAATLNALGPENKRLIYRAVDGMMAAEYLRKLTERAEAAEKEKGALA